MDICQQYKDQIARLYGDDCANASAIESVDDRFFINVAVEGANGQELRGQPQPHTLEQLERMIAVLSLRKPGVFSIWPGL